MPGLGFLLEAQSVSPFLFIFFFQIFIQTHFFIIFFYFEYFLFKILSKTSILSFRLLIIQLHKKKMISKNKVIKPSKHYDVGCKLKRLTWFDPSLSKMLLSWYFFLYKEHLGLILVFFFEKVKIFL